MAVLMMVHKKMFEMFQKPVVLTLIFLLEGHPFKRQQAVSHCLKDSGNLPLNRVQNGLGAENIFSYLLHVEKRPCCNTFLAATPNIPTREREPLLQVLQQRADRQGTQLHGEVWGPV